MNGNPVRSNLQLDTHLLLQDRWEQNLLHSPYSSNQDRKDHLETLDRPENSNVREGNWRIHLHQFLLEDLVRHHTCLQGIT